MLIRGEAGGFEAPTQKFALWTENGNLRGSLLDEATLPKASKILSVLMAFP